MTGSPVLHGHGLPVLFCNQCPPQNPFRAPQTHGLRPGRPSRSLCYRSEGSTFSEQCTTLVLLCRGVRGAMRTSSTSLKSPPPCLLAANRFATSIAWEGPTTLRRYEEARTVSILPFPDTRLLWSSGGCSSSFGVPSVARSSYGTRWGSDARICTSVLPQAASDLRGGTVFYSVTLNLRVNFHNCTPGRP